MMGKKCREPDHEWRTDGNGNYCRTCRLANRRDYRRRRMAADPEFYKKRLARQKARPGFEEQRARAMRLWRYGIDLAPSGMCHICERKAAAVLDHDHKTGQARGFLCHGCNLSLGRFERAVDWTDREWASRAASYLASPPFQSIDAVLAAITTPTPVENS